MSTIRCNVRKHGGGSFFESTFNQYGYRETNDGEDGGRKRCLKERALKTYGLMERSHKNKGKRKLGLSGVEFGIRCP